jgi:FdhE protein
MSGAMLTLAPTPWLRPPRDAASVFARRAARLRALAAGHSTGDWLGALAALCDAQAVAVPIVSAAPPPRAGARPLARDPAWQRALAAITRAMRAVRLPAPARDALARLDDATPARRERWGDAILGDSDGPYPAAAAPFLGAALQTLYTAQAARVSASDVTRGGADCPLCGFRPVAATVQGDDKVRYLCCGLCAAEWHLTRIQCASCGDVVGVSYYSLEAASGEAAAGVKAETCATCRSYLKLFYREQIPDAEPLADDAATLALDLLLGEAGYARGGVNLLVAA